MPERTVALLEPIVGPLTGQRVAVLGAAYRGGVKETAFSGVFGTVAALESRGAEVLVHDPLYDDDELRALGFTPYHLGEPVDAAVVQADHAAYARARARADLPGRQGRRRRAPGHRPGRLGRRDPRRPRRAAALTVADRR